MTSPSASAPLKTTPLNSAHRALGGKMVPFGGWDMPVQYSGILDEHKTVRTAVGLFDVSHMGEVYFRGPRALEAVQGLMTNHVATLQVGAAAYTLMCYPDGGIVDDCIVYRTGQGEVLVIINAGNIDKDVAWMRDHAGTVADVADESDAKALLAVQGPKAVALVSRLADHPLSSEVPAFHLCQVHIAGVKAMAARTGYTGEDGFELLCSAADARVLWDAVLEAGQADGIKPIGLGARDTLRLEAKLCLYGNDIDASTTPLEAALDRFVKFDHDFIGKDALVKQKAEGTQRKLVGFQVKGRGIARHDYAIFAEECGTPVGKVTSGTTAPSLGIAVGMGYVPTALAQAGKTLFVDCRGKIVPVEVCKGPFYKRSQG